MTVSLKIAIHFQSSPGWTIVRRWLQKYTTIKTRISDVRIDSIAHANFSIKPINSSNQSMSMVSTKPPKTTIFRLFLENAKFKSRINLDRKFNNFAVNNFWSSFTWYIQIFRAMASFRELSVSSRPCLLYIVDLLFNEYNLFEWLF